MNEVTKTFVFFLTLSIASAGLVFLTFNPANAQSIPKPSVPEFTILYISHPYDVPTTTTATIDPYTGAETVTTHPGYHVENKTLYVQIENQPFSHQLSNGTQVNLYYQIRAKGHYEDEESWHNQFRSPSEYAIQSDEQYTLVPLHLYSPDGRGYQDGAKWDVEVQALIGNVEFVNGRLWGAYEYHVFNGVTGDWSAPQIFVLNSSATTSPTATPSVPELSWLAIVPLLLSGFSVAVVLNRRKTQGHAEMVTVENIDAESVKSRLVWFLLWHQIFLHGSGQRLPLLYSRPSASLR